MPPDINDPAISKPKLPLVVLPPPDLMGHFEKHNAVVKLAALGLSLFLQRFPWRSALFVLAVAMGVKPPW